MHYVDFVENALFKSSGDIFWPPWPSSLLIELSLDERDSSFLRKQIRPVICSSYNSTDSSQVTVTVGYQLGKAGPKSTRRRFVGIIASTIYPYACSLSALDLHYGRHYGLFLHPTKSKRRIIVDVIMPTNLVCVCFGPAIPTPSFNFKASCNVQY